MGSIIPYITQPTRVFLIAHLASRKSHVSQSHISSHKFITYLCLKNLKISRILFWGDLCHRLFWSHQQKIRDCYVGCQKSVVFWMCTLQTPAAFCSNTAWVAEFGDSRGPSQRPILNLPSSKVEGLLASRCDPFLLLMAEIRRSPVEVGSLSHYLQGFIHPRWCRSSAINSLNCLYLEA